MAFVEDSLRRAVDIIHRQVIHPYLTSGEAQNDREIAHERALKLMESVQGNELAMGIWSRLFTYEDSILETSFIGRLIPIPLGLAAGLDKDARVARFLENGFGIVTVGSVTKVPYKGNERPRIFDLPKNDGLINRMGFPGGGTDLAEEKLKHYYSHLSGRRNMLIVNIAASRPSFDSGTAIEDYTAAYKQLVPYADAIEVNISSPNTPGVRGLQEPEVFEDLASHIGDVRRSHVPLGYKFSPDLSSETLQRDIRIAIDHGANFVTLTNTSTDPNLRDSLKPDKYKDEVGGMSGALLETKALQVSYEAYQYSGGGVDIVRVGGIGRSARDIWDGLTYGGATVVETYAAFVRRPTSTPNFTYYLMRDLANAMRAEGMTSMEDFKALRGKGVPFPKI